MKKLIIFNLGSNIGNKENNLNLATTKLITDLGLTDIKKSRIFKSKAMLKEDSPKEWDLDFFNISVSAKINIEKFTPLKILEKLKQIEKELGRIDRGKWAPREIDIDILLIEDNKVEIADQLTIPHYDLQNREFFTKTLEEILPNWREFL